MAGRDILILSAIDWDFTWQRHQILATYFAEHGFRVFYVNGTMIKNPDIKSIKNAVKKYKRKCINTLKGWKGDAYGCLLDLDKVGINDKEGNCPTLA